MIAAKTSKSKRAHSGLTLPEVLIAGAVMLLVMGVSAELTKMAYRTFAKTSKSTQTFQEQTLATDLLNRELRLCTEVIAPGTDYPPVYTLIGDERLIFKRYSPSLDADPLVTDPHTVVSYRYDPEEKVIIRESYEPGFILDDPTTHIVSNDRSARTVASKVEEFLFDVHDPDDHYGAFMVTFQIEVKTGEGKSRIGSTVRVRSL